MKQGVFLRRFPARAQSRHQGHTHFSLCEPSREYGIGLAPGSRVKQEIIQDPYDLSDWDTTHTSRCFVHIVNDEEWQQIAGKTAPIKPHDTK